MEGDDFKTALEGALQFFPGIKLEREQELCLESLLVKRKDVLGVLPTGYGKSLIYRAPVAHLVVHCAETREVVSSRLRPDQHSGSLNN